MFKSSAKALTIFEKMLASPQEFDFIQVVRLIEWAAPSHFSTARVTQVATEIQADAMIEVVRFRAAPSLAFPVNTIQQIAYSQVKPVPSFPLMVQITFHGLFGPSGLLPHHYTEFIIQRLQVKDTTLKDFFDLFNQRLVELFWRSMTKYRFYLNYERVAQQNSVNNDFFTQSLKCLIGRPPTATPQSAEVTQQLLLYFAGYFAQPHCSAIKLQNILAEYFAVPVKIKQFQGKWLSIPAADYSRLAALNHSFNQLGKNTVLGQRIWDCQYHFRIQIGPLSYKEFKNFLPLSKKLMELNTITRGYIEVGLNFDAQLILKAQEVPLSQLGGDNNIALGWNTWLRSKSCLHDVGDTILPMAELKKEHIHVNH
jgi:type VI secretion system protein ImpH